MIGMEAIINIARDITSNGLGLALLFIFFIYPAFIILRFFFFLTIKLFQLIFAVLLITFSFFAGIGEYIIDELKPENRKADKIAVADRRERRRKQEEAEKAKKQEEKAYKVEHKDEIKAQNIEKKRLEKKYNRRTRLNALEKSNYKYFIPEPGHPDGPMGPDYPLRCKMEEYRKGTPLSTDEKKLIAKGLGFEGEKFGGIVYGEQFWELYEWRNRKNEWKPTQIRESRNGNRMTDRAHPEYSATSHPNVVSFKPKRK